jgi:hypothetical protein
LTPATAAKAAASHAATRTRWPSWRTCVNRAGLAGGAVDTNSNIAVFRFKDGLISEYRDYFDPRRFQTVIDAVRRT